MGLRLRLKAGYGLGGFSGPARTIAEAMKRYGLIVADNGSNWYFSGSSDRRWDDENLEPAEADPRQRLRGRQERRRHPRLLSSAPRAAAAPVRRPAGAAEHVAEALAPARRARTSRAIAANSWKATRVGLKVRMFCVSP